MKWLVSILVMLTLALWPEASVLSDNDDITGQGANQLALVEHSITSGLICTPESSRDYSSPSLKIEDSDEINPGKKLLLQQYITPKDSVIIALADKISESKDAYKMAVQWTYISDEKLNQAADKWLTPHEYLTSTPYYLSNPLQGEIVSDCEEKANTLVSLIRAKGVRPEEVRVVLGEVYFSDVKTGHAWVELFTDGHWLALDPCWGPYWDDKAEKLVNRRVVPFDYYADHNYPVLQVWTYYNDTYYLDPRDSSGNAPVSWHEDDQLDQDCLLGEGCSRIVDRQR